MYDLALFFFKSSPSEERVILKSLAKIDQNEKRVSRLQGHLVLQHSIRKMSSRSTPVKKAPSGSPARTPTKILGASTPGASAATSTPSKPTPSKSPSSGGFTPAKATPTKPPSPAKTSSAVKANAEGSWNLQGVDGGNINLETNVVHQAFQINKQLTGNGLDVEEEAKEVMLLTSQKLTAKNAKVEAFKTKTEARADAVRKANKKFKKRPASAPAATPKNQALRTSTDSTQPTKPLNRREAVAAKKIAEAALFVKPLPKKRAATTATAKAAASAASKTKVTPEERAASEAKIKAAQRLAARRAKDTALKEQLKAMEAEERAAIKPVKVLKERAPLDAPLQRLIAEKTTAPKMEAASFNVNDMSILQLSGLVSPDGSQSYIGVDPTMAAAFEALGKVSIASIREIAAYRQPPPLVEMVMEAVCILVGEDPGWVTCQRLLKRRDFFPALAVSTIDNIPFARIKKFRSRHFLKNPIFNAEQALNTCGVAAHALCLWVLAIDSAAPPAPTVSTYPDSTSPNNSISMIKSVASPARTISTSTTTSSAVAAIKGGANTSKKGEVALATDCEHNSVVRISSDLAKTILGARAQAATTTAVDTIAVAAADDDEDLVSMEEVEAEGPESSSTSMSTAEADAEFVTWLKTEAAYEARRNGIITNAQSVESSDEESEESSEDSMEDYEPDPNTGSSPYMVRPPVRGGASADSTDEDEEDDDEEEDEDADADAYDRLGNSTTPWEDVDGVSDFMEQIKHTTQQAIYADVDTYTDSH